MIPSFHAHIYYDEASRAAAQALREELGAKFEVQLGSWREEPVGPHPQAMYQVTFAGAHFAAVTQWLMLNRRGLPVLVHPETGAARADHSAHALWMGRVLELNLDAMDQTGAALPTGARSGAAKRSHRAIPNSTSLFTHPGESP